MKKMLLFLLMFPIAFTSTSASAAWSYTSCIFPWEEVKASDYASICRLSVPKGWILLTLHHSSDSSDTTTFIPDESHEWVLDTN